MARFGATGGAEMTETTKFLDPPHTDLEPPDWFRSAMAVPRRERRVEAAGAEIHAFEWGDPEKPGLVMLHGFLAHAHCFAFIAPFLAADHHVVAYDLSGMGDSGRRPRYGFEDRIDELNAVTEAFGLFDGPEKPVIIAHSFGGAIALSAIEQHAERYAGLLIADTFAMRPERLDRWFEAHPRREPRRDPRPNRVYPDYETAKARFVLSPPQPVREPYLFDYMAFHSLKETDDGWTWKFDPGVLLREEDGRDRLYEMGRRLAGAPGRKAIVYGEESRLFDADCAAYVRECVRELGAAPFPIVGLPHAGHHLMLDQPIALAGVLRAILGAWAAEDGAKRAAC